MLSSYNGCEFTYNASGIRTCKKENGKTTNYISSSNKLIAQTFNNNIMYFHYGESGVVGFTLKQENNETYEFIYQKNLQGDVTHIYRVVTVNGVNSYILYAKYKYDAWGNHTIENIVGNIGDINPLRYRGYYYDALTKLYYCISRYYDPEIGRFINADDVSYLDPESLNGLNLYSYCLNDPVNLSDSTGTSWLSDF